MSSSNESELIASMEDMEVKEEAADSFNEGDLVFAKSKGYIAWPGIIVETQSSHSMVNFLGTDDTRRINNAKIWPYNEDTKAQYITSQNLKYLQFRDAILIAEKLNCFEDNTENGDYCFRVLSQSELEAQNGQEKESQEEASPIQEKSKKPCKQEPEKEEHAEEERAVEEHAEEEHAEEEHTEEKHTEEEHAEEEHAEEEPGDEETDQKDSGRETPGENDDNTIKYLRILRSSRDSLNGNLENKFIGLVNFLRNSLKINHKDFPAALWALQELHALPLSELLLVRNFEAVHSIYLICFLDTAHRNYDEATHVKLLARQLITRIASMYNVPDTLDSFMELFRSLSVIYRRYTQEFEPTQRESSKEEYCHELVAVGEEGQESLAMMEDGQESLAMEEDWKKSLVVEKDGQESLAVEKDEQEGLAVENEGQESLAVEEEGQESLAVEKDGQEGLSVEDDGLEVLALEDAGQEALALEDDGKEDGQGALAVEEGEEKAMFSLDDYYRFLELEDRFDYLINTLRRCLTFRQKDYPSALLAFDELLSFTFTKDFLMPKFKAVYFIYYLGRSGGVYPSNDLAKATLVRNLANQLMVRFFSVFNLPGITAYDFMVHFCSLYPETIPFEWDSD